MYYDYEYDACGYSACVKTPVCATCQPDDILEAEGFRHYELTDVGKLNLDGLLVDDSREPKLITLSLFMLPSLKDNDSVEDTLKLFFELESLGIKDDPCYRKDDKL
ncbi:hypothetical protein TNIN_23111 [Trichonephila inaurata madagascariensis]|uniref:Uncharacterized protein n=1 Tax=Trichonephila inaurata madagascariensis TaxID=2747483 RepID=A0A8X6Y421_9ARAC|nr:hypothetical protein TNIN_23111 [Trichonephila inaurata madagascariensis]